MRYGVDARAYLERATSRIAERTPESLFYAAFELRAGIESRLQEYLEAQQHIAEHRKAGWRIPKLAKNLEQAFKLGDRVVEVSLHRSSGEAVRRFFYTPVKRELQKLGQRLGDLLHSQRMLRAIEDPWWGERWSLVQEGESGLKLATTGTLLGPPLYLPETKEVRMHLEFPEGAPGPAELVSIGELVNVEVAYLENLPA